MNWSDRFKKIGVVFQQTGIALKDAALTAALQSDFVKNQFEKVQKVWQNAQKTVDEKLDLLEAYLREAAEQGQKRFGKTQRQASRAIKAKQYYALFGLKPGAKLEEVKAAWRKKMRECHPDRFAQDPEAESKAQAMAQEYNIAYQELTALLTGREDRRSNS